MKGDDMFNLRIMSTKDQKKVQSLVLICYILLVSSVVYASMIFIDLLSSKIGLVHCD